MEKITWQDILVQSVKDITEAKKKKSINNQTYRLSNGILESDFVTLDVAKHKASYIENTVLVWEMFYNFEDGEEEVGICAQGEKRNYTILFLTDGYWNQ